jgi:hypothetical protein
LCYVTFAMLWFSDWLFVFQSHEACCEDMLTHPPAGSQSGKENSQNPENQSKEDEQTAPVAQPSLMAHLSESTFMRLKDSGTGLHSKVLLFP